MWKGDYDFKDGVYSSECENNFWGNFTLSNVDEYEYLLMNRTEEY